jgi:hypothetical protein
MTTQAKSNVLFYEGVCVGLLKDLCNLLNKYAKSV